MCMLLLCHMHVKYTCSCRYYATCMSNTHVHVATMPHECQVDVCMFLLCHMHVKYACACATMPHACQIHMCIPVLCCMHVKYTCAFATMPHAYQTLMCMLLLCHVHVNLPTIPRYVIDPYQISFIFIPTRTQCMYHRASYISTVLDSL